MKRMNEEKEFMIVNEVNDLMDEWMYAWMNIVMRWYIQRRLKTMNT